MQTASSRDACLSVFPDPPCSTRNCGPILILPRILNALFTFQSQSYLELRVRGHSFARTVFKNHSKLDNLYTCPMAQANENHHYNVGTESPPPLA